MKIPFFLLAAALAGAQAFGAVSGTVTIDGRAAPGVVLSDGLNVTRTDADGRYTLPAGHRHARFVSLSVPERARVARPWLAIDPARAEGYDFALASRPADSGAFIQITDTEMSGGETPHYRAMAAQLKALAEETAADFVVHTGDICYARGLREHQALFRDLGVPLFWCIGNHDLVDGPTGEALFEQHYGPAWYSFNAAGTHFVVLPMPGGDRRPSYTTAEVAAWLRNDLAAIPKGTPLVVFCHDLLFTGDRFVYGGVDLVAHNLKTWVYGHWHINLARRQGAVETFCTNAPEKGGIDASVAAFRIFRRDAAAGAHRSELRYATFAEPAPRGRVRWSAQAGGGVLFAPPLVLGDRVCVATLDEDLRGTGGVTAFDAEGRRLWRAATRASVKNALAADPARGLVFAQDVLGWVYAFAAGDGALRWERRLPCAPLPGLVSGLTLADGTLYAGAGQSLSALDPATGEPRWQGGGWRLREGTPDRPIPADGAIVQGSHWDALYATDAATGKLLWRKADPDLRFRGSIPAPEGKNVWVTARKALFLIEARTGKVLKKKDLGFGVENNAQPLLAGDLIVLTTVDAGVVALDRATLAERWRGAVGPAATYAAPYSHAPQPLIQGSPVLMGEAVAVAAADGTLRAFALADGRPLGRVGLGAPLLGTPALSADGARLYAADLSGTLHCVPTQTLRASDPNP